jgi:hypothetical protein
MRNAKGKESEVDEWLACMQYLYVIHSYLWLCAVRLIVKL